MSTSTRLALSGLASSVLLTTALAACGNTSASQGGGTVSQHSGKPAAATGKTAGGAPAESSPATPAGPEFTANVKDGDRQVKVDTRVSVKADQGTLSKVTLTYTGTDSKGRTQTGKVPGTLTKDKTSWTADDRLEPAATYELKMVGTNPQSETTTTSASFSTEKLALSQQTFATVYPLKGSEVGVGMPVILTFDVPVRDKAEFERNLHVTASPAQTGSWHWYSRREVHFRPEHYWKPGTKVTVNADLNGVNAGNGIYGQDSVKTSFTVGDAVVTKVDLGTDVAKVYRDGKLARTIPVSGGKAGWQSRSGTKLIMSREYTHRMTNQMIGAAETYDLNVHYAMRVTNSGEFLHAAPWNAANFGRRNASHGCVGMSTTDAAWLFDHVRVGDPVITTGTSRGLEPGNGYTDWNASFGVYKKGSAL